MGGGLSMSTQRVSAPQIPTPPSRAESRPWSPGSTLRAEGWGPGLVTPFPCPHPPQGSSDFCVDPDTYVTRMVEEHSVLSGGESVATSELVLLWPGWGDPT